MEQSGTLAFFLPALLVMAGMLLMVTAFLAFRLGRQRRLLGARIRHLERTLGDLMVSQQRELHQETREMADGMVQVIGEVSRLSQQQLDAFGAQVMHSSHASEARLEHIAQALEEKLLSQERRMAEMRQTMDGGMQRLYAQNDKKLEQIRQTVDEKLNATLDKRLGESFRTVSERLEQVYKGLGEMQTLALGVGDLKKMLMGVKTRGIWGEVQLGALLSQVLTPQQYEENAQCHPGRSERVEFAVRLPGSQMDGTPVLLPIDAKFPAEDYQRLIDAAEDGDKRRAEEAGRALESTIRGEAKRIRDKYITPPFTTDFAIMFLPVEGLFAQVLSRPGITEALQRDYRIVLTGPTTLLALLNSLQMGFRTVAIEQRTGEVWALLGAVKTEFGRFADLLSKTQQRLRQASDSIDVAARKTRTIERRLKDVESLSQGMEEAAGVGVGDLFLLDIPEEDEG